MQKRVFRFLDGSSFSLAAEALMKACCLLALFFFFSIKFSHAQTPGEWTWMNGASTANSPPAVYGIKGTPAPANTPPGYYEAIDWTDTSGNFWLCGGYDSGAPSGAYGDVWKFDPSTNQWTWMNGSALPNPPPVYGTKGVPAPGNSPGLSAWCAASWVDTNGKFWMFGGSNGGGITYNAMWMYDPSLNEWTWMNGPSTSNAPGVYGIQGVAAPANCPPPRWESAATWVDNNNLWLLGGYTNGGNYGDLWKYDISINQWAWMRDSGIAVTAVYGLKGFSSPTYRPGARQVYAKWKDAKGDFWFFGGSGEKNDVWRYRVSTNQWAWMGGSMNSNDPGVYGAKCVTSNSYLPLARHENRATWMDANGNFWFFGGYSNGGLYNDLWRYCPESDKWTWIKGDQNSTSGIPSVAGTKGISSPTNKPAARMGALGWKDKSGNFWMWGGWTQQTGTCSNDMWRYVPDVNCGDYACALTGPSASFISSDTAFCNESGRCIDFTDHSANNPTSWKWFFPGAVPDTSSQQNPTGICYYTPGTYAVTLIVSNSSGSDSLTVSPMITFAGSAAPPVLSFSGDTIFCSHASAYQWYFNGSPISGATDSFYVATAYGNYAVQITDGLGCTRLSDGVWASTNEIGSDGGLRVYPNPAGDQLTIDMGGLLHSARNDVFDLSIYNVLGETILQSEINSPKSDVNLTGLAKGVYFVELRNDEKVFRSKFVKK